MFGPKTANFAQKYAFLGKYRLCGSFGALLVGGCGAWAVSRKTPIYYYFFYQNCHRKNVGVVLFAKHFKKEQ